jgi:hypothetical protein
MMHIEDNPGVSIEGIEFMDFPEEKRVLKEQAAAIHAAHPGLKVVFHIAHTLYATNEPDRYADSKLTGPDGQQRVSGGPPNFSPEASDQGWGYHVFYPAPGNKFHDAMMKSVDVMMDEMGFSQMSVGAQFVMMPVYEDLLRVQAIEFNDLVRKSSYSFELVNNKIKIFPIPVAEDKLWFDYYVVSDKTESVISETTGSVSDASNAPFKNITYSKINDIGRMWITKFTVALCKEMLGGIRSKYQTIPIPNAEVTLDGAALRQEAHEEKEKLIQELRETLNESGNKAQMQKEMENAENMQKMFSKIPNTIYIG